MGLSTNAANLKKKAYELYIHDWMIAHHIGKKEIEEAIKEYIDSYQEAQELGCEPQTFFDWLSENGFHGTLWACYDEFLNTEGNCVK